MNFSLLTLSLIIISGTALGKTSLVESGIFLFVMKTSWVGYRGMSTSWARKCVINFGASVKIFLGVIFYLPSPLKYICPDF